METSEELNDLAKAMSNLQACLESAKKVSKAHHGKYANLTEVWRTIRAPLTENGLSVVQTPFYEDGICGVESILLHSSGQFIKCKFGTAPPSKDPQKFGIFISYYRRYSLNALIGVDSEDDDGDFHSKESYKKPEQTRPVSTVGNRPTGTDCPYTILLGSNKSQTFLQAGDEVLNDLEKKILKKALDERLQISEVPTAFYKAGAKQFIEDLNTWRKGK